MDEDPLREQLAAYAHAAWSGWMNYLFDRGALHPDGSFTIPVELVLHWQRQMRTPYKELPENEQASDLLEADRILALLHGLEQTTPDSVSGLTIEELAVMENLINAWNMYVELPSRADHQQAVRAAVCTIQGILALRVVARQYPDYWSE